MRADGLSERVRILGFSSLLSLAACGGMNTTGGDSMASRDATIDDADAASLDANAPDAVMSDAVSADANAADERAPDANTPDVISRDSGAPIATDVDNLIANPGAEAGPAVRDTSTVASIPSWERPSGGSASVVSYSAGDGFPEATTPGPTTRGSNFFTGGDGGADTVLTQTRPLPPSLVDSVDTGLVDFEARGWFGGFDDHTDRMALRYEFLDAAGAAVGEGRIGNVTAAERMNVTGLYERTAMGAIPARTRSVRFSLEATFGTGYVDAYADELAFYVSTR